MQRRELVALIGATAVVWPFVARAQQTEQKRRVGVLMGLAADDTEGQDRIAAFEQGLQQLGWTDGSNLQIDYRRSAGDTDLTRRYANELVALAPDVILASGGTVVGPLLQATRTVPIVFTQTPDPVAAGFVASLARPGGNATGFTTAEFGTSGKWLELLKDVALRSRQTSMGEAAHALGLTTIPVEARGLDALEQAFAIMVRERAQAFVVLGDAVLFNYRGQIAAMALRNRLPAASYQKEYADAGFLLTYGVNFLDLHRRSAAFVDKIFKGAKPADLPVEQPTKFELVINLKTAKALGATDNARPRRRGD